MQAALHRGVFQAASWIVFPTEVRDAGRRREKDQNRLASSQLSIPGLKCRTGFARSPHDCPPVSVIATWLGLAALALYACFTICYPLPTLGRDTGLMTHFVSADFEYASSPIDLSVISPFQGLGGQVQPISVWINPAFNVGRFLSPANPRTWGTLAAMLLLSMATFALGRGIGLPGRLAAIAAQLVGICSFPPMWL